MPYFCPSLPCGSIKLFRMLLDNDSEDPSWRAWKVHYQYFNLMFQDALSRQVTNVHTSHASLITQLISHP